MRDVTDTWRWRNFKKSLKRAGDEHNTVMAEYIETLEKQIMYLEGRLNDILRKEEEKEDDLH